MVIKIFRQWVSPTVIALLLAACSIGPSRLEQDRFDYAEAIGESWKEQVLANLVRLRYHDWPTFLEVQRVLTAYTSEGTAIAKTVGKFGSDSTFIEPSAIVKYSERPTILYSPITGARYAKILLTPLTPAVVFGLIESGFPADTFLQLTLQSINGHLNQFEDINRVEAADPAFLYAVGVFRRLRRQNALQVSVVATRPPLVQPVQKTASEKGIITNAGKGSQPSAAAAPPPEDVQVSIEFYPDNLGPNGKSALTELKAQLGLDPDTNRFNVVYSPVAIDEFTIAVETRPVLRVLNEASSFVEVPAEHLRAGIVLEQDVSTANFAASPPLRINSGKTVPPDTYASIRHLDYWFWINSFDHDSKMNFGNLLTILSVIEGGETDGGQVVIPTSPRGDDPGPLDEDEESEDSGVTGGG